MSKIILEEQAAPSTPAANKVALYAKAGGGLYFKDDAGIESALGRIHSGTGTFAGVTGVTISIGSTLAGTSYRVAVTPLGVNAADLASIGPVGVGNKTTSSFDVFNLGSEAGTQFDWILINNS